MPPTGTMRSLRRFTSMLVLCASLAFGAVAGAQPAPDAAAVSMYCVAADVVVRARPAPAARRLRRLAIGARLQVLAREGAWIQVALPEQELVGWVPSRTLSAEPPPPPRLSDREIRRILIRASIEAYDGNCPCPYFDDAAGRACGRRSAWSREGGESPYCYPADVPIEAVEAWRAEHEASGAEASAPR
jgi:hypothetical protein